MAVEVKLSNLTEDEAPKRNGANLDDYRKMLKISQEQDKPYGIDVNREASSRVLSRFRLAASELGLGVRLQVIDSDEESDTVRIRFLAKPKTVRKASAVKTTKMTAAQKAAAAKKVAAAKKAPTQRRTTSR